jgi:uncharacterized protein (TIGR03083 family)
MTRSDNLQPLTPIYTTDLFTPLRHKLIDLLRGLASADWERPTVAGDWRVRDVAAHLLDVDLRKLSVSRDRFLAPPDEPIGGYGDLVRFLNRLNSDWVAASRRLSPRVLVDLLAVSGPAVSDLVAALPLHEPALFSVAWAGESQSENWFDIGRDYTERWHHQMQIRDAVGAPLLLSRRLLHPLLDLSIRALPRAYESVTAKDGTAVVFEVTHEEGLVWSLIRKDGAWQVWRGAAPEPTVTVRADPDTAWRLLYNALPPATAREKVAIQGDPALAAPLLSTRSVMV